MPVSKRSNDDAGGSGGAKRSRKEAEVPTLPVAATPPSVLQPPKPPSVPAASPKGKKGAGKKAAGDAKAAGAPTKAARKPRATSSTSANNPAEWMRMYGVLKKWLKDHGGKFPKAKDQIACADGTIDHIGTWCVTQRQTRSAKRKGKLTNEQIKLLDDLGFTWSPNKTKASGAAAAPASASAAPASAPRAAAAPPASKGAGKGPQPAAPPAPK
eukprot:m.15440 g.15440  ORF g.15440 m.15440 type:complete len:213 (+) comp3265_c0_seq1:529-1167(+)